jgi:hypothetical protein
MRRLILLPVVMIFFALETSSQTPSSVTGMNFSAPRGQVFYGQIASFRICSGVAITAIYAEVDWGDQTGVTGAEIPDPLYLGRVLGSHTYTSAGTYTVKIKLTATCWLDTGSSSTKWKDSPPPSVATATVPADIGLSSLTLSANSIPRGGTVIATVTTASSAPGWGTLVQLGSSNTTTATVQPGVVVQSGTTATFVVTTKAFSGVRRNVLITAVSGGVSASRNLRVN